MNKKLVWGGVLVAVLLIAYFAFGNFPPGDTEGHLRGTMAEEPSRSMDDGRIVDERELNSENRDKMRDTDYVGSGIEEKDGYSGDEGEGMSNCEQECIAGNCDLIVRPDGDEVYGNCDRIAIDLCVQAFCD